MTLSPQLLLWPEPSLEVAFKRRFNPWHKLSMVYNTADASFAGTYKWTPGVWEEQDLEQPLKLKLGYDSRMRLLWSSLWVSQRVLYGAVL